MTTTGTTAGLQALYDIRKKAAKRRSFLIRYLGSAGRFLPHGGKRALARLSPRLGYLLIEDGDFVITNYQGDLSMHIDARNNIEREMLTGHYDYDLLQVVSRYVKAGDVVVDIGANVGAIALPLCRQVGPLGKVVAVEPGPGFYARLNRNLELNPTLKAVAETRNVGLSDRDGSLNWLEDSDFPGNAGLLAPIGTPVPVTTLDSLLAPLALTRLDFMKIDVEGMELEVLLGARETLEKFHPKIIFESSMEFETSRARPVRQEAETFLRDLGYEFHGIGAGGNLKKTAYPHLLDNTLALPREVKDRS